MIECEDMIRIEQNRRYLRGSFKGELMENMMKGRGSQEKKEKKSHLQYKSDPFCQGCF